MKVIRNAVKPPAVLDSKDKYFTTLIDINTADEKELETLPMIGPVKAAAISDYRQKHGPFARTSDIINVKGIGPSTYEKIKTLITIKKEVKSEKIKSYK